VYVVGIEPRTLGMLSMCSTAELHPRHFFKIRVTRFFFTFFFSAVVGFELKGLALVYHFSPTHPALFALVIFLIGLQVLPD
jgi:hypothetical protein